MNRNYIIVAGVTNSTVTIKDGDREVDQGNEILIVLDKYMELSVVCGMLKNLNPNIVIVSTGIISLDSGAVPMLNTPRYNDNIIINDFIFALSRAILVKPRGIHIIYRVSDILNPKTKAHALGDIIKLLVDIDNKQ